MRWWGEGEGEGEDEEEESECIRETAEIWRRQEGVNDSYEHGKGPALSMDSEALRCSVACYPSHAITLQGVQFWIHRRCIARSKT